MRGEKNIARTQLVRILRERGLSEDICLYGRIILKLVLKEKDVVACIKSHLAKSMDGSGIY